MPQARRMPDETAEPRGKDDWVKFFGTWVRKPRTMGAIAASSPRYCDEMVARSTTHLPGRVLELGAGLGAVTRAILRAGVGADRITSVEYDPAFASALRTRFPDIDVIQGDGLDLTDTLAGREGETFSTVLLAIPVVRYSHDRRRAILDGYFDRIGPGGNVTQLSYYWTPPIQPDPARYSVSSSPIVWANLPPARVWVYRRAHEPMAG